MRIYRLDYKQHLSVSLEEAWRFFSDPRNLPKITPAWLSFSITSEVPERIYPGLIITYRIKPLLGIPVTWVTEITHLIEPRYFVDEQRFGPYSFWHHQHIFKEKEDGVEVRDIVHYAFTLGPLGRLIGDLTVERKLHEIFSFRRRALADIFNSKSAANS